MFAILDHPSWISNVRTAPKLTQKSHNKYQDPRTVKNLDLQSSKITSKRMATIETLRHETKTIDTSEKSQNTTTRALRKV